MALINFAYIFILLQILNFVICAKDHLWHSYQFGSGHNNREELVISQVNVDDNFKINENIFKWKSLSLKFKSYALGLSENGVNVLVAEIDKNKNESFATNTTHTRINGTVLDAALFEFWNHDSKKVEVIALIAVNNTKLVNNITVDLLFFRITTNNHLLKIWEWNLQKTITHMEYFTITSKNQLLICNDRYKNYTTADLYEFNLGPKPDFWLVQVINLERPTNTTAINKVGTNVYLSIPQENKILILQYSQNHFIYYKNVTVGHAKWVDSFDVGYQSFLAIDGFNAGVYKFTPLGLEKQEIHANLDGIDFWLSIPLKTYRNEEILISERTLEHGTHTSPIIEVMLYHDGKFVVHDEMECKYFDELSNGMSCLIEDGKDSGIKGAAAITVGDLLGILMPQNNGSRLFMIHYELKLMPNPLETNIIGLSARKDKIQKMITARQLNVPKKISEVDKNLIEIIPTNVETRLRSDSMDGPTVSQFVPAWNEAKEAQINIAELSERTAMIQTLLDAIKNRLENVPPIGSRNRFQTLIVNGLVEVHGSSNIKHVETKKFNGGSIEDVFGDIVRLDTIKPIPSHKTFVNVEAEALTFNTVNGINANNIAYKDITPVIINGDIIFKNLMDVQGLAESDKINNIILEDEIIQIGAGKKYENLQFEALNITDTLQVQKANKFPIHENYLDSFVDNNQEQNLDTIEFETIFLPGNITVDNIQGEDLNELISSLCLKNLKNYIPNETKILGDINVLGNVQVSTLNELQFPDNYVLSNSNSFTKITGEKQFTNIFYVQNELITHGTINDIDPNQIITLSQNQTIPGHFEFNNLEVTENMNVNGKVISDYTKEFLQKPTLLEQSIIKSNFNFKHLEVIGPIIIDNNFNDTHFATILNDIVYKNEDSVTISSVKEFPNSLTVLNNLNVISKTINNIPIDALINKELQQEMHMNHLQGVVTFENLFLTGLYGDINITKLDQDTVKLTGEQFVSSKLIFEEPLLINELEIVQSLNDAAINEYLFINSERNFNQVDFETIKAVNMEIGGHLLSDFNNFNLDDFDAKRLSLTTDQVITADVLIKESKIPDVKPELINGHSFNELFDVGIYNKKIYDLLYAGKFKIKDLIISDSLNITKINEIPMEEITKKCIRTSEKNNLKSELKFQNNVFFQEIATESLNGVNMMDFAENLIYKNETRNVTIDSVKIYVNGFDIINYVTTHYINNILIENILRTNGEQIVSGELHVAGDVTVMKNVFIQDYLNGISMNYFRDVFQVINDDTFQINGDAIAEKSFHILEMQVDCINGENITDFLENIVLIHDDRNIPGVTRFLNKVTVNGNLAANKEINGVDLSKFKDDVVLITQDGFVEGLVNFISPVNITNELVLESDLLCPIINGINLQDWKDNAVFINKGKLQSKIVFEKAIIQEHLNVSILNNIDMNTLIPLRTEQIINQLMNFQELASFRDIVVYNLVNGYNLETEYQNTALTGRIQQISSDVIFESNVLVRTNLDIIGSVNGQDITKVVTLNTPQNLTAKYEFNGKTTCNGHGAIYGLINGINVDNWIETGVKKYSVYPQNIMNSWNGQQNVTFGDNVIGVGALSNFDIRKVATEVEEKRLFKDSVENKLLDDYYTICNDINGLLESSKKQIYKFKYLEDHQFIDLVNPIEYVHQFEHLNVDYILINEQNSCMATLFVWSQDHLSPVRQIETGQISQIITVKDGELVYLITTNDLKDSVCGVKDTNLWIFDIENLSLLSKIEPLNQLQDALVGDGTFFGINNEFVLELKIERFTQTVNVVRKWLLPQNVNGAFVPHGLTSEVSMCTGKQLYKFVSDGSTSENDFDVNTIPVGNYTAVANIFMPGLLEGDMVLMKIGYPRMKNFVAVASHEETMVKGRNDFVKIYENIMLGTVYHTIPSYNPTSLISLEFNENGETLLIFLEDYKRLQVYEYKGIEGFKHRTTANIEATKLIQFKLNSGLNNYPRNFIGLINKNRFNLIKTIMDGDQVINEPPVDCKLV